MDALSVHCNDRLRAGPLSQSLRRKMSPGVGLRWPDAAWGDATGSYVVGATQWPRLEPRVSLLDVVDPAECNPLTQRAAAGFLTQAERESLNFTEGFLEDVRAHTMQFPFD